MKKLRVLQVCYSYPPSFSGYGKQLDTVNRRLLAEYPEIEIELLTAFDRAMHSTRSAADGAVSVQAVFRKPRSTENNRLWFFLFCLDILLTKAPAFLRADVVHVVKGDMEAAVSIFLSKMLGKKTILKITQKEVDDEHNAKRLYRRFLAFWIARADHVIALNRKTRNDLIRVGLDSARIVEIPNAVDTGAHTLLPKSERLEKRRSLYGFSEKTFVLLYAGTISKRKGIGDLLAALDAMGGARELAVLIVGPDYGEIEDFERTISRINARRNGVTVRYLGAQEKVPGFLELADALVIPSYSEGMANVVLESFASGVPVLASDIAANRELVSPENGMTFRVGDREDLIRTIEAMAGKTYDASGIRSAAVKKYDIGTVANRYHALYRGMAAG